MAKAVLWAVPDTQARKRGEQTGLDTRVVHTLNDAHLVLARWGRRRSKRVKCAAWEVRPQG